MSDQNRHNTTGITEFLKQVKNLSPACCNIGVAGSKFSGNTVNGLDAVFTADIFTDQFFKPVCRVNDNGLKIVRFITESCEFRHDLIIGFSKRELFAVNLAQTIFGLNKDWIGGGSSES